MTGAIAAALAKAQAGFGTVKRDKKVTVRTKTGGTYEFSYAPLDTILDAVRKPLAENGLVVVQMLDGNYLVTMLLHESGDMIQGSVALPSPDDIQGYGSAVTYLRRYAIQALLGIAAEDDDDGNRAAGNEAEPRETKQSGAETLELMGRIQKTGTLVKGGASHYDGEWRDTPTGHAIGFKFKLAGQDRDIPQVLIGWSIGEAIHATYPDGLMGATVTLKGHLYGVKQPGRTSYYRLIVGEHPDSDFVETDEWRVPALPAEAETVPLFALTDDEKAAIAEALP